MATVLGMSWSLRSRKIGRPSAAIARTPAGPLAAKNSSPSFTPPICVRTRTARSRARARSGVSSATYNRLVTAGSPPAGSRPDRSRLDRSPSGHLGRAPWARNADRQRPQLSKLPLQRRQPLAQPPPDQYAGTASVGTSPSRNVTSNRNGRLVSAINPPGRLNRHAGPVSLREHRRDKGEQAPEQDPEELHRHSLRSSRLTRRVALGQSGAYAASSTAQIGRWSDAVLAVALA